MRETIRLYPCARCGNDQPAARMSYSRWTGNRYCRDLRACEERVARRSITAMDRSRSAGTRRA